MKKLYLIRHAKSSWKDITLDDFDRPLNKRGKKNAPFMAQRLRKKDIIPDLIISSPANRAKTTAQVIAKDIGYKKEIQFLDDIYEASIYDMYRIIHNIDNKCDSVFIFGHNPSLNFLANDLINMYDNIPTCGIVEIAFECDKWKAISSNNSNLLDFDYPKKDLE